MLCQTTCTLCGKLHQREIALSEEELHRIEHRREMGLMIQDIIPHLTADDREFFLTGAHPACWEEFIKEEQDDHD